MAHKINQRLAEIHMKLAWSVRDNTPGSDGPSTQEVARALMEALAELGNFCDDCSGSAHDWRGECKTCKGTGSGEGR